MNKENRFKVIEHPEPQNELGEFMCVVLDSTVAQMSLNKLSLFSQV